MKKIITCSAVLLLLLTVFSLTSAMAETQSGTCGDNLTWTLDEDGLLTISGTGEMNDYSYALADYNPPPWEYTPKQVVIKSGVTSIGRAAFWSSLTSVTIPDTVTSIGDSAFNFYSNNLTDVFLTEQKQIGAQLRLAVITIHY